MRQMKKVRREASMERSKVGTKERSPDSLSLYLNKCGITSQDIEK